MTISHVTRAFLSATALNEKQILSSSNIAFPYTTLCRDSYNQPNHICMRFGLHYDGLPKKYYDLVHSSFIPSLHK